MSGLHCDFGAKDVEVFQWQLNVETDLLSVNVVPNLELDNVYVTNQSKEN
jgi:hypothetical protein